LDEGEFSQITAPMAHNAFNDLAAGLYRVVQALPDGWMLTGPSTGAYEVMLEQGQTIAGRDFANFKTGEIHGIKFHDLDADGTKDEGEPALAGWTVFLACVPFVVWCVMVYWGIQAYQGKYVTIPVVTNFVQKQGYAIREILINYRARLGEKKLKARHGFTILRRILRDSL
jgi:hypothetical protein